MKNRIAAIFILVLFILGLNFSYVAAGAILSPKTSSQEMPPEASKIARDFTSAAIAAFKSINDSQLSYSQVSSKIDSYSENLVSMLLGAGVDLNACSSIMQQASVLYGQTLEALFRGKGFNAVIQDYSAKVSDLLKQQRLGVMVQSKIISMSSDNLESLNSLFKNLTGILPY